MSKQGRRLYRWITRRLKQLNPTQARIVYDFLASLLSAVTIAAFRLYPWERDLPDATPLLFIVPLLTIAIHAGLGIYSRARARDLGVKTSLIAIGVVATAFILSRIGVQTDVAAGWALYVAAPLMIPRAIVGLALEREPGVATKALRAHGPILVVGGGGYIGSELVAQLLKDGESVRVLDKLVYGDDALKEFRGHPRLELIEGDATDLYVLTSAMYGASGVVHLAGLVGDPACAVDEDFTRHVNIFSTRMVKEVAKSLGVPRFVFASSCSVYGIADEVLDEKSELNPVSLYARTKIDSERELLAESTEDFNVTILRFATVFGHSRRPRFDLVVNLFSAQAYVDGLLRVFGPSQWRPFIHVRDVARSIAMVLKSAPEKVSGQIFNVGDSRMNMQIGELANLVQTIVGAERPVSLEINNDFKDARNYTVSFEKIKKALKFEASVFMEDGIRELVRQLKTGQYGNYKSPQFSNVEVIKAIVSRFYDPEETARLYAPVAPKGPTKLKSV